MRRQVKGILASPSEPREAPPAGSGRGGGAGSGDGGAGLASAQVAAPPAVPGKAGAPAWKAAGRSQFAAMGAPGAVLVMGVSGSGKYVPRAGGGRAQRRRRRGRSGGPTHCHSGDRRALVSSPAFCCR